ncbi:MAG: hypothetical protein RL238_2591 [Actinomycetota bacterium]|jgi:hypothetical protein
MNASVRRAVSGPVSGQADAADMTTFPQPSPLPPTFMARLQREWDVLSHRPAVLRRAADWQLGVPFRSLDDLTVAAGLRPLSRRGGVGQAASAAASWPSPSTPPDVVLHRLVELARHDDLAARVVLQRLLPGLVHTARRWARRPEGGPHALEEVVTAAWQVVRTYPLERRPHHLAANLLRDAEYHAFVRAHRATVVPELLPGTQLDRPVEVDEPGDTLDELVAVARRRALSTDDLTLLALLLSGATPPQIAAAMEVSVRTVGHRREALVHRLRRTADELLAA